MTTRYRHRARLHTERQGPRKVLGFLPAKGRGVIPVNACMVLEKPVERALQTVARILAQAPDEPFDVTLSGEPEEHGGRVGVFIEVDGRADVHRWRRTVGALLREGIQSVEVVARGRPAASSHSVDLRFAVAPDAAGGPYFHDASVFTQGNRWQNLALQKLVLAGLALDGTETIAELHAGSGNFTIPVAQRARKVVALESHPRAVEYASRNLKQANLQNKVVARVVDCDRIGGVKSAVGGTVDALLLDPPRTGAPALLQIVQVLEPRRIVYVSCNTATLARDLAHVVSAGWKLKHAQPVDLFPRTWHVEAVAVLERA